MTLSLGSVVVTPHLTFSEDGKHVEKFGRAEPGLWHFPVLSVNVTLKHNTHQEQPTAGRRAPTRPAGLAAPGPLATVSEVKGHDPSTADEPAHRQSRAVPSVHTSWFVHGAMLGCTFVWHRRQQMSVPRRGVVVVSSLWLVFGVARGPPGSPRPLQDPEGRQYIRNHTETLSAPSGG